jgi:hypothetical protein
LSVNTSLEGAFDRFAPGWGDVVGLQASLSEIRGLVFEYWRGEIARLGARTAPDVQLITGEKKPEAVLASFGYRTSTCAEILGRRRQLSYTRGIVLAPLRQQSAGEDQKSTDRHQHLVAPTVRLLIRSYQMQREHRDVGASPPVC